MRRGSGWDRDREGVENGRGSVWGQGGTGYDRSTPTYPMFREWGKLEMPVMSRRRATSRLPTFCSCLAHATQDAEWYLREGRERRARECVCGARRDVREAHDSDSDREKKREVTTRRRHMR